MDESKLPPSKRPPSKMDESKMDESKTQVMHEGAGFTGEGRAAVQLVVIGGSSRGLIFDVDRSEVRIGRRPENDLVLDSHQVSKAHARVFLDAGRYHIEDLESSNHTWINETQLEPLRPRLLCHGDSIQVADHLLLFLQADAGAGRELAPAISIDRAKVRTEADQIFNDFPWLRPRR